MNYIPFVIFMLLGMATISIGAIGISDEFRKHNPSVERMFYPIAGDKIQKMYVKGTLEWESDISAHLDWSGNSIKLHSLPTVPSKQTE